MSMSTPYRCLRPLMKYGSANLTFKRTLVHTKDGALKARGMKKDESEYMTSWTGINYPGDTTTLEPAKKLLGNDYNVPDQLILQALTHKSFAHGKRPFNERLANLGRDFLRLSTQSYAVQQQTTNPQAINGLNFDVDTKVLDLLSSTTVLSTIAKQAGIDKTIFWKNPQPTQSPERSGENTVCAKSLDALVGAVLLYHGQSKALSFVQDRLLKGTAASILSVSEQVYAKR